MSKSTIGILLIFAFFCACKSTSTSPSDGQKLRLITSDQDTVSLLYGPVTFTLTVLDGSGYGVSGAYIDFYDPIEQRARHEGPTPEDGELMITDSITQSNVRGDDLDFAFVAEHSGEGTSDSVRLWVHEQNFRDWAIDSLAANSLFDDEIGVQWVRPLADLGTDTVFVTPFEGVMSTFIAPYPQNRIAISNFGSGADTISVHNQYVSSNPIIWATANYTFQVTLYESADSSIEGSSGLEFIDGDAVPMNYSYYQLAADLMILTDSGNGLSGISVISPSLSVLSGFSYGRKTAFYHPIQFIDSGYNLRQLYYSSDLSSYVNGAAPLYDIPLPDSCQYSTAFIAVTQDGNYARVCIGPVTRDYRNARYVHVALSYQPVSGLPYARANAKAPSKH